MKTFIKSLTVARVLLILFLLVPIICIAILYGRNTDNKTAILSKEITSEESGLPKIDLPEINLPVSYFSSEKIVHGSYDDTKKEWNSASLNEMTYQSYPTTTITIPKDNYSNQTKPLGKKRTFQEILEANKECGENHNEDCGFQEIIKKSYTEQNDFAPYYLPWEDITTEKADLDGDKIDETIVYSCGIGGNHCPHSIDIVKGNNIIFSFSGGQPSIKPNGNGFYLEWSSDTDLSGGFCCPWGYVRTKFVFNDKKFIPILEQKVYYLRTKE